jgi:hypothetical protein
MHNIFGSYRLEIKAIYNPIKNVDICLLYIPNPVIEHPPNISNLSASSWMRKKNFIGKLTCFKNLRTN